MSGRGSWVVVGGIEVSGGSYLVAPHTQPLFEIFRDPYNFVSKMFLNEGNRTGKENSPLKDIQDGESRVIFSQKDQSKKKTESKRA
jgi:hypothetical protein